MLFGNAMLHLNAGESGWFLTQHNGPNFIDSSWEGKVDGSWLEGHKGGQENGWEKDVVLECKMQFKIVNTCI